jgi:uncharacterized protein YpmB
MKELIYRARSGTESIVDEMADLKRCDSGDIVTCHESYYVISKAY